MVTKLPVDGRVRDADQALAVPATPANTVDGPAGFDPSRGENLIHRVILAITSASVPHEAWLPGALGSRSLGYYLGVGIDHFGHDYARHEILLRKAAEQAIAAIAMEARQGGDHKDGRHAKHDSAGRKASPDLNTNPSNTQEHKGGL